MALIKVVCVCGWLIESNDVAVVTTAAHEHDAKCPLLFKPDVVSD